MMQEKHHSSKAVIPKMHQYTTIRLQSIEDKTSITVGIVLEGWGEDPHLAEEHGDQEGGAGRVGGWGQQVGHPGGGGEHCGGDEVD